MRIDRMLAITIMLLNRERISARELADRFEVSVRTIYRDIEAINIAGIPVVAHSGINGGFSIMENYKIDRQLLTLNDMMSIITALNSVNLVFDDAGVDSTIEKIRNLVPREKESEINLRSEQIVIDLLPWGYPGRYKKLLKEIQQAVEGNSLINLLYTNSGGETVSRIVEPMTLVLKGYVWYVFAFCRLRNDYRIFRLSRITGIVTLQETFVRKSGSFRDIPKWENDNTEPVNLVLKFSPEMKARVYDYFDDENIKRESLKINPTIQIN
ncbi:MAG: YafY family transcriptional regulator [Spirochaetes bacterium]|nr:YafY family transcriptional regulator [Spirochaetota bacterium]